MKNEIVIPTFFREFHHERSNIIDKIFIYSTSILVFFFLSSCSTNYIETKMTSFEKAHSYLDELVNDSNSPGVQYIIVTADSVLFEYNGGSSNLEANTKLNSETTFNAFSVTKTFTALAILMLEDEGKLNIDDPVQHYLKDLPYKTDFTIRQCLNHTSGLPNPIPLKWIHLIKEHEDFNYKEFIKNVVVENDKLNNQPGKEFSYSNIGYLLLGEIIEKTSGESCKDYINNNIIKKLSLTDKEYLAFKIPDITHHSHGYIRKWSFLNFGLNFIFDKNKYMEDTYKGWTQFKYFCMNGYAFGGLIGNARGFAKYLQMLLRDSILISNKQKGRLFEKQKIESRKSIDMCLSWFPGKLHEEVYYTHSGGGGGYYCEIRIYADMKIASVIMLNRTGISDERILDNIDKYFL